MMDSVRSTLKKATELVDAPRRKTEEAVRKMAENPNFDLMDAPKVAVELMKLGLKSADKARSALDDEVRRRLLRMGMATKEEVERLHRRIAELEAAAAGPTPKEPEAAAADAASAEMDAAVDEATAAARPPRAPRSRPAAAPKPRAPRPRPPRPPANGTGGD